MNAFLTLTRHEFRRAAKSAMPRLVFALMPLVLAAFLRNTFVVANVLTGPVEVGDSEQVVPGMAVLFSFVVLVYFGYTAFDDFGFGMWDRLRVSGVRSVETLSAKAVVMATHLLIHLAIVFAAGIVFLRLQIRGAWWEVGGLLFATAAMCVSYAFMAFAFSRSNAFYNAFCYVGAMALTALGGGLVPYQLLPNWAQHLSYATPAYWSIDGLQLAIGGQADSFTIVRHLVALGGFVTVFVLLGVWRFDPNDDREAFAL